MTRLVEQDEVGSQDFTRKIVIVLAAHLASWEALNTVAHISAYLGNKMRERFESGSAFVTKDGKPHPRNSQFPIILLSANPAQIKRLIEVARDAGLLYHAFIREMLETSDDEEIVQILSNKLDEEVECLGIGMFGKKEELNTLTKKFSLWK